MQKKETAFWHFIKPRLKLDTCYYQAQDAAGTRRVMYAHTLCVYAQKAAV